MALSHRRAAAIQLAFFTKPALNSRKMGKQSIFQNKPEQFTAQLQEGQYNELRVALWFMLRGYYVKIGLTNQAYDISVLRPHISSESKRVEVKWDKACAKTGNLYFEIENTTQKKASGVAATSADIWCHVTGDGSKAIIAEVVVIKNLLEQGRYRTVQTRGADSNSRGKLIPLSEVKAKQGIYSINLPTTEDFFGALFRKANNVT